MEHTVVQWHGPGDTFAVLWDGDDREGLPLPEAVRLIYGDWYLPQFAERPYVYANFVISHDGRVSFGVPGAVGGGTVSRFNTHDQWLMGLLRARADAVVVGDNTLRLEPEHCWTAEYIYPPDAAAFAALRQAEGRASLPLHIFASFDGNIYPEALVFHVPGIRVLIATTAAGVVRARGLLGHVPAVEYLALGHESVDLSALMHVLRHQFGTRSLLCEGGPTLYGSLLEAGQVDDEFLTLSPVVIGEPRGESARPSLVEGVGFPPDTPPTSRLLSVRRVGDYLFLRSRYR
jgi:riboflavin biosynthesis pyrimidine reductase